MNTTTSRKKMFYWALYDGALAPYHVLLISYVFSAYFINYISKTHIQGVVMLGYDVAITALLTAVASVVLGPLVDRLGRHKYWIAACTVSLVIASIALFFSYPSPKYIYWALIWLGIGLFFYGLAPVFHNAMLVKCFPQKLVSTISGWGWAANFAGGFFSLLLMLLLSYFFKRWFSAFNYEIMLGRASGIMVAVLVVVFSLSFFLSCDDIEKQDYKVKKQSFVQMMLLNIKTHPQIFFFQLARLFYVGGLMAGITFIGVYMVGVFKISMQVLIFFAVSLTAVGSIPAFFSGKLEAYMGTAKVLRVSLLFLSIASSAAFMSENLGWTWVLMCISSLAPGLVLSASRTLMCQLSTEKEATEIFGTYSLFSQLALILGPFALAFLTSYSKSQRVGMFSAVGLVLIGWALLFWLKSPKTGIVETR